MQQLLAESVRREQIAATCSLWTPDGKPDVNKVQQELDEPGSIVTEEFLEALHQKDLKDEGFVYVESVPNEDQLRDELQACEAHLRHLQNQVERISEYR